MKKLEVVNSENKLQDMLEGKSSGKKSQFHGAMHFLVRIDEILRALDNSAVPNYDSKARTIGGLTMREHQQRLSVLSILFRELSCKMSNEEKQKHLEFQKHTYTIFQVAVDQYNRNASRIDTRFLDLFNEWEIRLREFAEFKGLIMPEKAGADEATDA